MPILKVNVQQLLQIVNSHNSCWLKKEKVSSCETEREREREQKKNKEKSKTRSTRSAKLTS